MAKIDINSNYCKSCELCILACKKDVIIVGDATNKMGYKVVKMDPEKTCVGCKMCAVACPEGAIEVYK